ncbi:hypothetical protein RI444_15520 [Paenarthrobacter sp. AT5]|uniref:hypothetical protein n=1 Tax=Paenarthrobacter TaxID=1742992 RepID=UPI001A9897FF|nr:MULTISPECIES: hypothetical protein [Paenarthrobacter]QSZ53258.1 hypothetical protein AYX19_09750 [Paenarthrobacter ureafaciens]WOC59917.1 hypothetical protein RI444_15520 [Paenarthrobacter sp. AT5]
MIRFNNITVTDSQRIDLEVERDGAVQPLWFAFSQPVALTDDTILIALSTLCARVFKEIHFDLSPSAEAIRRIEAYTLASVTTRGTGSLRELSREGTLLSFSGGFDSLAAYCLMPLGTELVSMDFMGRFARERAFFEKHFKTITVQTNLLETGLHRNSWAFMGIGAILTSQHTRAEFHTFGSIFEAGPDNMSMAPAAARNVTFPPFAAAGFTNAPFVVGLTEIGTLQALMHYRPEMIRESLASVASPGEEKLYRKQVLTQVVAERQGVQLELDLTKKPTQPHFAFGQNFALDLLALYVAKHAGEDVASDLLRDIPSDAFDHAKRLDLTFFERANTNLFQHFPPMLFGILAERLADAGIQFYTEQDWREFRQIRRFLAPYHPAVAA